MIENYTNEQIAALMEQLSGVLAQREYAQKKKQEEADKRPKITVSFSSLAATWKYGNADRFCNVVRWRTSAMEIYESQWNGKHGGGPGPILAYDNMSGHVSQLQEVPTGARKIARGSTLQ